MLDSPGQRPALTCLDQLDTEGLAHLLHRGQQRAVELGREPVEVVEERVKLKEETARAGRDRGAGEGGWR